MILATVLIVVLLSGSTAFSGITIYLTVVEENVGKARIGSVLTQAHLNISRIPVDNSSSFSILSSGYSDLFVIESNGDMYAEKKINREEICLRQLTCVIAFDVAVTEGVNLAMIRVEITVQDINDNFPNFFPNTWNLAIPEGTAMGTSYELPSATDLDVGINSIQRFVLAYEGTNFGLEARQNLDGTWALTLVLNLTLDRETCTSYNLTVQAVDGGQPPLTGMLTISLTVLDVNDNRPVFLQSNYTATIEEDAAILTEIVTVTATDRDSDDNGRVSYYFANTDLNPLARFFGIAKDTGTIFVKEILNSQTGSLIVMFVEAKDNGNPPKKSIQCQVTINVINKNNNAPDIRITLLGNVTENSLTGTPFALIQVIDTDTGLNGEAVCTCDSSNFTIHSISKNNFRLDVGSVIDREVTEKYAITINCSDKGDPSLSSNETFEVWVQDVNDNAPQFSQSFYVTTIQENNEVGEVALQILATDRDIDKNNCKIRYQIQPFEYSSSFLVDDDTGVVKVIQSLDYEEKNCYVFNVTATDYGQPPRSKKTTVFINITDLNDNVPNFRENSYAMSVMENANLSTRVGQVIATDKDSGTNGKVSYMIPSEYRFMPFKVFEDGTVITTEIIDRESNSSFQFAIVASDFGDPPLSSTVLVVYVTILDQNDNEPKFEYPNDNNRTILLPGDVSPNVVIATIIVHDDDENNNSFLTYNISDGNTDGLFGIDPFSGAIQLTRLLLDSDTKESLLTLSARDHGDIPFETLATLQVNFYVAMTQERDRFPLRSHNILIAIVISCATFVISVIIILVIYLVSKKDQDKHPEQDHDEQKMISQRNSNRSMSSRGSMDKMLCGNKPADMENMYQDRGKTDSKFSFEASHDTGVSEEADGPCDLTSTFKSSSPALTQSNEISPSESQKNYESRRHQDLRRMESFSAQQRLTNGQTDSSNNNSKQWPESPPEEEFWTFPRRSASVLPTVYLTVDWRNPITTSSHPDYMPENRQPSFTSFHGSGFHKPGPVLTSYLNKNQNLYNNGDIAAPINDLSSSYRNNIYRQQKHISESNLSPALLNINGQPALVKSVSLLQNKMDSNSSLYSSERSNLNTPKQLNNEGRTITGRSQEDDETSSTSGSYVITDSLHDMLQLGDFQNSASKADVKNKTFNKQDTFV